MLQVMTKVVGHGDVRRGYHRGVIV
jgi:hypothetical protein